MHIYQETKWIHIQYSIHEMRSPGRRPAVLCLKLMVPYKDPYYQGLDYQGLTTL